MSSQKRILIGTVGYHNLRNHSIGPILLPHLQRLPWPSGVQVEELNWGPVAIAQRLQAERPAFDRIVLVCARSGGRSEGTITLYRWRGGLPEPRALQARMGEAVSGVINVDNLLVVGQYFRVWPQQLYLVDIAPGRQQNGPRPTTDVAVQVPRILDLVRKTALSPAVTDLNLVSLTGVDLGLEGAGTTSASNGK